MMAESPGFGCGCGSCHLARGNGGDIFDKHVMRLLKTLQAKVSARFLRTAIKSVQWCPWTVVSVGSRKWSDT